MGVLLVLCGSGLVGCDRETPGGGEIVKAPIVAEMRTIIRDVRIAEERAATERGRYLEGAELIGYLDRAVPANYRLEVSNASADGYRARVVHGPSGLACELEVRAGASGSPRCD